ncbi:hypothetical protein RI367_003085 [Sorochytrium milnesiophthora]
MRFTLIVLVALITIASQATAAPLRTRALGGNGAKLAQVENILKKAFGEAGNISKVAADVVGVVGSASTGNVLGAVLSGVKGAEDIAGVVGQLRSTGGASAAAGNANLSAGAGLANAAADAGTNAGLGAGADNASDVNAQ